MGFKPTTANFVKKLLLNLDSSSSPDIPTKVIKHCDNLVDIILKVINKYIETNTVPVDWKTAVVMPLCKSKGERTDINSYRGISVISPVAKIFEKVIASQLIEYLMEHVILSCNQHGFRSDHSCESALHELITDLNIARNESLTSMFLFIVFQKAFDLAESRLLLKS